MCCSACSLWVRGALRYWFTQTFDIIVSTVLVRFKCFLEIFPWNSILSIFYASVQNRSVVVFSVCLTPSDISCMVAGSSMFAITSTCRAIFSSDWITSCEHACSSTVCGLPDSTKKFVNTVSALARIQCTRVYTHVHKIERKRMQIRLEYKTEIEALKPLKILGFWRQKSSADLACSLVRTTLQKDIDSCCFFICGTRFWWSHVLPSHHFIYLEWFVVHSYLEMRTLHVIPQKWTG